MSGTVALLLGVCLPFYVIGLASGALFFGEREPRCGWCWRRSTGTTSSYDGERSVSVSYCRHHEDEAETLIDEWWVKS